VANAIVLAQRIRQRIGSRYVGWRRRLSVSCGISAVEYPAEAKIAVQTLLARADRMLYEAKRLGKGRIAGHR
jgi:GGDEF domain-containing protein